jgi:hypothetical protein
MMRYHKMLLEGGRSDFRSPRLGAFLGAGDSSLPGSGDGFSEVIVLGGF